MDARGLLAMELLIGGFIEGQGVNLGDSQPTCL